MRIVKVIIVAAFVAALGFLTAGPAAAAPVDMPYDSAPTTLDMPYD